MTPGDPIINESRQAVQFSVSERGGSPDVMAAAAKSSAVLGEKLQERYRWVINSPDPFLSRHLIKLRVVRYAAEQLIFNGSRDHAVVASH